MSDIIFPTIHLNGTSAESLQEYLSKAHRALYDAREALDQCAPNARDYYFGRGEQKGIASAVEQHAARCKKIHSVMEELDAIFADIDRQKSEREKAKAPLVVPNVNGTGRPAPEIEANLMVLAEAKRMYKLLVLMCDEHISTKEDGPCRCVGCSAFAQIDARIGKLMD